VAEQHDDTDDAPESAMPARHLRRVELIERQRDQSKSEAVSSARARQRPVSHLLFIAAGDPPPAQPLAGATAVRRAQVRVLPGPSESPEKRWFGFLVASGRAPASARPCVQGGRERVLPQPRSPGGQDMYAVVVNVSITDVEQAQLELREQVIPMVSQVPGFVSGVWMENGEGKGHSVVVLESEGAANAMAQQVRSASMSVTVDEVSVHEVFAHA
jgi:hypothetical protein